MLQVKDESMQTGSIVELACLCGLEVLWNLPASVDWKYCGTCLPLCTGSIVELACLCGLKYCGTCLPLWTEVLWNLPASVD
jgi:hypothetical protein